jgi:hypothetical protein
MKCVVPILAAVALAFGPLAIAETTGSTSAPMDAIKARIESSFAMLNISVVNVQVVFVHGTAVGKSASTGSRVVVSFTQVPGKDTTVVVTTDGPEDPELERSVLESVIGGSQ